MNKRTEQNVMLLVCTIGLFALLTYTFVHTGAFLARFVRPAGVGYMAAFGVEIIIAALAWRLSRGQTKSGYLTFALVIALVVSAFANVYEGYAERYGEQLTVSNMWQIDIIQAVLLVFATALISVLVFAISDIVGGDVTKVVARTERENRREQKTERPEQVPERVQTTGEQINYQPLVFSVLANGEQLGPTAMAERVGCNKTTAHKHIKAYHEQNPLPTNTNGNHRP